MRDPPRDPTITRATEFAELRQCHRSIRAYEDRPLDPGPVDRVLERPQQRQDRRPDPAQRAAFGLRPVTGRTAAVHGGVKSRGEGVPLRRSRTHWCTSIGLNGLVK